jgi:ADP-ribose pyrophosphatase YjhB (NUDIX family)
MERPKIGVGVMVINNEGKILLGKRKNAHGTVHGVFLDDI